MSTKGLQHGRESAARKLEVQGALYTAFEDEGICPLCSSLDGLQCRVPSEEYDRYSPPLHCFCNCMRVYINKEEEGWRPDDDWGGEITKRSGGIPPDDLIDKHGHANSTWEKSAAKGDNEVGVTYRTMEREAKKAFGAKREKPPETETSGGGEGKKPPATGGGKEPPMGPREPDWVNVPDDWTDKKRSDNPEIAKIQEFLGKNVKEEVIRKHLLADGIGKPGALEITNIRVSGDSRRCTIVADYEVNGVAWKVKDEKTGLFIENSDNDIKKTGKADMTRILHKGNDGNIQGASFSSMGVGVAKLPNDFADEYYLRVIPFLQKIGAKSIETVATTEGNDKTKERGRLLGAYIWARYGYTNGRMDTATGTTINEMAHTKEQFLKYLQEDRGIKLSDRDMAKIEALQRMIDLAGYRINKMGKKLSVGKDFLLGDDGTGKYVRDIMWNGVIPDINNIGSDEMVELMNKFAKFKRR